MSNKNQWSKEMGLPAFELRLVQTDPAKHTDPYALVLGPRDSHNTSTIAYGSRHEMRNLRTSLLVWIRSDCGTLDTIASALAALARKQCGAVNV